MQYCINPFCPQRDNPTVSTTCQQCGTKLLIYNRYQIARSLCDQPHPHSEVFEVNDRRDPPNPKVLKTLKAEDTHIRYLFGQEQQILLKLNHPGIPKGEEAFTIALPDQQSLHCLVMEKIQGQNLEKWLKEHGAISQPQAIAWLEQLTQTLNYIHRKQLFHRDIKPSNIVLRPEGQVVLIDFGTARQITTTIAGDFTRTSVVSLGFTAPEQLLGRAVLQSDFYALGRTMMTLLMGHRPSEQHPFEPVHPISPEFRKLLNAMTSETVSDRPRNAQAILGRLKAIESEAFRQKLKIATFGGFAGLVCGAGMMIPVVPNLGEWRDRLITKSACDQELGDQISCGEEALIPRQEVMIDRNNATDAVRAGKYGEAIKLFDRIWQETQDPEALVYLNNAKIENNPVLKQNRRTIAVVAPLQGKAMLKGLEILRGVAQAQTVAIGQKIGLRVVLVDDANDKEQAKKLAKELTYREQVLAVIGHHASDMTKEALPIYRHSKLVLISPTSTSEELNTFALDTDPIFFRTVPSDRVTAIYMVEFLRNQANLSQAAIFFNPDRSYSKSLSGAFREAFQVFGGTVLSDLKQQFLHCEQCQPNQFDPNTALKQIRKPEQTAIVLVPDAAEHRSKAMENALKLIKAKQDQQWVIAGDSMAGESELTKPQALDRVIVASVWDKSTEPDSILKQFWQPQTRAGEAKSVISWRTFTAYNAAQVLMAAMSKEPSREGVRKSLHSPNFRAIAADGQPIQFRPGTGELDAPKITLTKSIRCQGEIKIVPIGRQC